jgi:iron complex transport system permease protein
MPSRPAAGVALLAVLLAAAIAVRLAVGSSGFGWPASDVARYRIDAATAAAGIGAALAIAGLLLQVLLRNPLASPFVLGLSSGAGFGYMLALYLGYRFGVELGAGGVLGVGGPVLCATAASLVTLGLVWRLGSRAGGSDPLALVLAGVVVSAIAGAGIVTLQSLVPNGLRGDLATWMMGRIPDAPPRGLLGTIAVLAILGTALATWLGRALDAASLSDDEAASIGLRIGPLRLGLFAVAGILTAATVALAGPIAFVGLVAPHAARIVLGARHAPLALGSALSGAILLVAADALRQSVDLGTGRLPVGVVTALIGGPVFLWLLRTAPSLGGGRSGS